MKLKLKHKLIGASAALLALGGVGTATALANTSAASTPPEPVSATDTDNVQQGDQNTPDIPGAGDTADSAKATESTNESKTGTETDGPGGHQDPPGNVDNQQTGEN